MNNIPRSADHSTREIEADLANVALDGVVGAVPLEGDAADYR